MKVKNVKDAVAASKYANDWQPGLDARRQQDKKRITAKAGVPISGSLYVEEAETSEQYGSHRWDYLFGVENQHKSKAVFAEVHPATGKEVKRILAKLAWLHEVVKAELSALPKDREFYWVATKGVHLRNEAQERRRLAKAGVRLVPRLELTL